MKSSVWFTQAEIKQIVEATTGQYKVLFHLAGYTGLRSGELVGLRVEDLKLEHGVIEVHRAVWNGIEGDTKTKSGKRNRFIDSATIRLLRGFLAGRQTGGSSNHGLEHRLRTVTFAEGF